MNIKVTVQTNGPFFQPGASRVVTDAVQGSIKQLADMGEEHLLKKHLRPRPAGDYIAISAGGRSEDHFARNLDKRVGSLHAIIDNPVVYGPWLEGVGSRNQTTRFKGYSMFRRTTQWLQEKARSVLEAHVHAAVRRLNGF